MAEKGGYAVGQVIMVVVSVGLALFIGLRGPGDAKDRLAMTAGYALLTLLFLLGMAIMVEIIRGNIDLSALLQEAGKGASMSRFQLLIFTFVIALSLFYLVVQNGKEFPKIPPEVLTLLGISASTYAVSKGIQAGSSKGDGDGQNGG